MKKPVLGIIAVICLQIGFVIYTANDRANDAALKTDAGPDEIYPAAGPPIDLTGNGDDPSAGTQSKDILTTVVRPRSVRRQKGATQMSRHTIRKPRPVPTGVTPGDSSYASAPGKPIRIKVEKSDTGKSDDRRSYPSARAKKAVSDKRSFVARVLPVLKKPYDWLKAIGSKFR